MSAIILDPVSVSIFRVAETSIPSFPQQDDYGDDADSDDDHDEDKDEGDDHDDDDHSPETLSFSSPTTSTQTRSRTTLWPKITSSTTGQTTISSSSATSLTISLDTQDQTGTQVSQPASTAASPTIIPALETQASTSTPGTKAGIALASILGILALASVSYLLFAFLPRCKHRKKHQNLNRSASTDSLEKGVIQLNLDGTPNQDTGIAYGPGARPRRFSFLARKWYSTGSQATQQPAPNSVGGHASTDPPMSTSALQSPSRSMRRSIREIGVGIGLGLGRVTPLFTRRTMMALQSRFSGTTATTTDTSIMLDGHGGGLVDNERERGSVTARSPREPEGLGSKDRRGTMAIGTEEIFDGHWDNRRGDGFGTADRESQRTSLPTLPLPVFSPTRLDM